MAEPDYTGLVAGQRAYFRSGATRPAAWRVAQLNAVKTMINENRDAMFDALWQDLRRNRFDADLMDVEFNVKEADQALSHLHEWMKPERVHTPLVLEPGHVRVRHDPLGVTLIIGAWNEPMPPDLPRFSRVSQGHYRLLIRCRLPAGSSARARAAVCGAAKGARYGTSVPTGSGAPI